ncbi:MAG: GNAT family N-acetyltransferase [Apibacter sp.]|uniref:GNAT family N-acetyltransferase n=1 Tax=Apibacter sp. TaxID=2023709 RepID=UPI0025D7F035|nr:GNAT family N-acetyltransferase [Apibacter sp.]MCT6869521.1 GNAT family N-acetyltransferase [Apibacter sp.]
MKKISIRTAVKADCSRIMELIHELADYEKAPEQVTVSREHFEESGFGNQPVWWAFVAQDDETRSIVGFALYYIRYSTWKGQRLYLEDLFVSREWRGRGIGSQLFDALLKEMRDKKFNGMVWQVLEWNESAIEFYKKYNTDFDSEWINCSIENTNS